MEAIDLTPRKKENDLPAVQLDEPGIDQETVDAALVEEFCQEMGLVKIDSAKLAAMQKAGCAVERLGITRLTSSAVVATQIALLSNLSIIQERIGTKGIRGTDLARLTHAAGYIADKIAKCASTLNATQEQAPSMFGGKRRRSFVPGQIVGLHPPIDVSEEKPAQNV